MKNKGIFDIEELAAMLPSVIFGAEGDDDGSSDDSDGDDNNSNDNGDNAGSDDANKDKSHDDADDPKVKGLKAALEAERKRAAAAEKRAKAAEKEKADRELAEKSDLEQAQVREQKAAERAEKLAAGLLQRDLNGAIRTAATNAGFIDPSDAIDGVERANLVYSQDDDDPSDITIDQKTVEAAVKALATKKPHFIKSGTDDGDATGSQFGGSRKKKTTTDDELRKKYPALR